MTSPFRLSIAANWLPKYRRIGISEATRLAQAPRVSQLKASRLAKVDAGEDAFFHVSTPRFHQRQLLGVADGVGSWLKVGIDPSQLSWSLMNQAEKIVKENILNDSNPDDLTPDKLLTEAYDYVVKNKIASGGSSTATILRIDKTTGILETANLGDASFMIIRNRVEVVYRSDPQQHFFNCPYQLSIVPEELPTLDGYISDSPSDAHTTRHQLQHNDMVVLATDGFFDSMFDEDTIATIQNSMNSFKPAEKVQYTQDEKLTVAQQKYRGDLILLPKKEQAIEIDTWLEAKIKALCRQLAINARVLSLDQRRRSPWTEYVLSNYPYHEAGRKIDDITVLMALIQKENFD